VEHLKGASVGQALALPTNIVSDFLAKKLARLSLLSLPSWSFI